ncbi:hypothetical protein OPV22_031120 [Ensete ventricosum]|uniref:PGG domain-containing protein n=1 Tax=Ensete ventricosum TaxID=4639 RepID=A0AAV8PND0_ENSVE|nr:hypothetical protein OPV22_031120 [Ensete ventricosum]
MSRELWEAARLGYASILGTSIPVVDVTAGGNSMLHIAAKLGHTDFCKRALDLQPLLLQLKNARGDTPLHVAARAGHHQLVNHLISTASESSAPADADDGVRSLVRMANNVGNTALHEAVQNGHEQVAVALMAKSPRVSAVTNVNGVSPLYMAVESGSASMVQRLLAAEEASCDGPNGQTALHLAALRSYRAEIIRMLLQQRSSLAGKADTAGRVPVHFAAARGDLEMVRHLLENDASTAYLQDNGGATAIHVAASFGYVNVIKQLIEKCPGCVEVMDGEGSNFFHVAISKRRDQL